MELVKQEICLVVRVRRGFGMESLEALHAYLTEEEAKERLKDYTGCDGEFQVVSTQTWFPPFN